MTTLPTSIPSRTTTTHSIAPQAHYRPFWRSLAALVTRVLSHDQRGDRREPHPAAPTASESHDAGRIDFVRDILPDLQFGRD